jgi:Tol biopolymer transport system component
MSERWQRELWKVRNLEPSHDLLDRGGLGAPDLPVPRPSVGRRVSIGLLALAIGIAGLVFVTRAFQRTGSTGLGNRVEIVPHANGKVAFLGGTNSPGGVFGSGARVYVGDPTGAHATARSPRGGLLSLAWSPDGIRIAYVDSYGEFGGGAIYVMKMDGSDRRVLVRATDGQFLGSVSWSPDGRWIAYGASVGSQPNGVIRYQIFLVPAGGGRPVALPTGSANPSSPAWAPDGKRIAFVSTSPGGGYVIAVINTDGTQMRSLTSSGGPWESRPTWSPDGGWILFVSATMDDVDDRLEAVRPDGSGRHTVYRCVASCAAIVGSPSWSPDGSRIAVTIAPTPSPKRQVIVMAADGSGVRPMRLGMQACCLSWQPVALRPPPSAAVSPTATSSQGPGRIVIDEQLPIGGVVKAASGPGGLYVAQQSVPGYRLSLVDPASGRVLHTGTGSGGVAGIVEGFDSVWVLVTDLAKPTPSVYPHIDRFAASDLTLLASIRVHELEGDGIAATDAGIWVGTGGDAITRIDPASNSPSETVPLPGGDYIGSFTGSGGTLLVAAAGTTGDELLIMDGTTGHVTQSVDLGTFHAFIPVATGSGTVLVGVAPPGTGSDEILMVNEGRIMTRVPVDGATLLIGGIHSWTAPEFGHVVQAIGPDGRIQATRRKLPQVDSLVARGTQVFVCTDTGILVAHVEPAA